MLLERKLMDDSVPTHLFSSFVAASAATILTQVINSQLSFIVFLANRCYEDSNDEC
jgi:hypothetical protein